VKKIVQRFTEAIPPSPSNTSLPNLHTKSAQVVLCVLRAVLRSFHVHRVVYERSTKSVESHTA